MGKGEEHDRHEHPHGGPKRIFEQPATLREPAAPRVPRVMPPSAVAVIPLAGERPSEARLATLQEAREATDALLREIMEEELPPEPGQAPARTSGPAPGARRSPGSPEEDWPSELHSLPLHEE